MKGLILPDFVKMAEDIKRDAMRKAGTEAVNHFKQSFVKGGFTDNSFQAWPKSDTPFAGKRTLYNQGILRDSIRKVESRDRIVVSSDVSYAAFHNEGATITVTKAMKQHFWKLYYEFSNSSKNSKGLKKSGLNQKAEFCKRMALIPEGKKIKIPKRQFIGNSATLMAQIQNFAPEIIGKAFLGNIE